MIVKKLDDVCDFISGLWTGKKPPYVKVGVIRNTNFQKNGKLNFTDIAQLDVEVKQFSTRQLRFGDIVLEKSGGGPKQPVGRVCVFEEQEGLFSLSNFTSAIRVRDVKELDNRYLHYFLQHLYIAGETEKIQTHSTGIRNLQLSLYKDFLIPLPKFATQQKIVAKLDAIFAEIDKAMVSAETNAMNAEALFQSFLSKSLMSTSESVNYRLIEICDIARGGSPRPIDKFITESSDGINWIKIGDATRSKKYIYETKERITRDGMSRSRLVNDGDFILSNSMSFGRPYIMRTSGCIHDGWLVLSNYQEHLDIDFFFYLLSSAIVRNQFERLAQGSTVRNLNKELVGKVEVSIPPLNIQKQTVKKLDLVSNLFDKAIEAYGKKIIELKLLRNSILKQAFSGELVKE